MGGTGSLTTYLGTAPGVGKTYAMLRDGGQLATAGRRVVVAWLERHGRSETRAQLGELEVVSPRTLVYRSGTFTDMDPEAVIASGADLALVDELAHTVVGTTRHRWEEVADILAAGIDVMTTANLANLVSARDYVARVTGAGTVESIPDELRAGMENVAIIIDDESPPGQLFGLYEGIPLTKRGTYAGANPDRITLFVATICLSAHTAEELARRVRVTLLHEVGHHFGMGEARLRELGWS